MCLFIAIGCQPDKSPQVTTGEASAITSTTATCGGTIVDNGASVTVRGVCYNTTGYPDINDHHTTDGSGVGNFRSFLTGLEPNKTYYVRAYAGNENGMVYGNEISFITADNGHDNPDNSQTPMEILTIPQGWKLAAAVSTPAYNMANGSHISDLMHGWFYEAELDDIVIFYDNGTHAVNPGSNIDYSFGYTQITNLGQWHFDNADNPTTLYMQLPFFYNDSMNSYDATLEECRIITLNANMLKIAFTLNEIVSDTGDTRTYTFTLTYIPNN